MTSKLFNTLFLLVGSLYVQLNHLSNRAIQVFERKNLSIVPYVKKGFILERVEKHPQMRCLEFVFENQPLLTIYESLQQIYSILTNNEQYLSFGSKKIVITHMGGVVDNPYDEVNALTVINLHSNVILDNDTSFKRYYQRIEKDIKSNYGRFDIPVTFYVKVWNADHLMNKTVYSNAKMTQFRKDIKSLKSLISSRSYSTKSFDHLSNITPLKKLCVSPKPFSTMDIETVNRNGLQEPFIISFSNGKKSNVFYNTDVDKLFLEFFTYLFTKLNSKNNYIYVHNLGCFDGIFIHKYVSRVFKDIETIIDDANQYILIKVTFKEKTYTFKDSLRLFPVSLNDLCKIFNVEGKLQEYNTD